MSKNEQKKMQEQIEALKAENAGLKEKAARKISLKVSEKGALSLYGLGRFPVTLYKEQWIAVLGMEAEIKKFIADNAGKLKAKE